MKIIRASILTALDPITVGTKVLDPSTFLGLVTGAVAVRDFAAQRIPGQGFLTLSLRGLPGGEWAWANLVSSGVGRRTAEPRDFVSRLWRGRVEQFLTREHAAPVVGCAAIVYTAAAYLADPDVAGDPAEVARVAQSEATHVLVAVLAFAGTVTPALSPFRLVANLAGGNREALAWSGDECRAAARASLAYDEEWVTVAD